MSRPRKHRVHTKLTGEKRAAAITLITSMYPAMSLDAIVAEMAARGVVLSRNTVRAMLAEAGVPLEPPGRTRRAKPKQRPGGGAS